MCIKNNESGAALIEFAILANVFIILWLGFIDTTFIMKDYRHAQSISHNITNIIAKKETWTRDESGNICKTVDILLNQLLSDDKYRFAFTVFTKDENSVIQKSGSIYKGIIQKNTDPISQNKILLPVNNTSVVSGVVETNLRSKTNFLSKILQNKWVKSVNYSRSRSETFQTSVNTTRCSAYIKR